MGHHLATGDKPRRAPPISSAIAATPEKVVCPAPLAGGLEAVLARSARRIRRICRRAASPRSSGAGDPSAGSGHRGISQTGGRYSLPPRSYPADGTSSDGGPSGDVPPVPPPAAAAPGERCTAEAAAGLQSALSQSTERNDKPTVTTLLQPQHRATAQNTRACKLPLLGIYRTSCTPAYNDQQFVAGGGRVMQGRGAGHAVWTSKQTAAH